MAVVQSVDGKFYDIPDDQLDRFLVPEDKVKERLGQAAAPGGAPPPGPPSGAPPGGTPTIVVQIFGAQPGSGPPPSGPPPSGAPAPTAEVLPYNWHNQH